MSVYVDALRNYGARIGRLGPWWCHMTADTPDELHAFAAKIGVTRRWAQHVGRPSEHYDLTASRRRQAVLAGAIETTAREDARRRRATCAG